MRKRKPPPHRLPLLRALTMCMTLLLVTGPLTVRADLKIVSNVKMVGPAGGKKEQSTITTYIKGNRTRTEMSDGVVLIYDHSTDLLYRIDPRKNTHSVVTLKPMFEGSVAPSGVPVPKLIAKVEMKPGSASRMIAGRAASGYAVTGSFTMQMEGVSSANMLGYTMEAEFWLADVPKPMPPNSALLAAVWYVHEAHIAPQQSDTSSSRALRMHGVNVDIFQQTLSRSAEAMWYPSLKPMLDRIGPFPGALLASKITMRLSKSPIAGSGVSIEATSVSEESLDDALFALPTNSDRTGPPSPGTITTERTTAAAPVSGNLAAFVGVYAAPFGELIITQEGDRLFGQGPGQPKEEFVPQPGNSFLIKKFGANITFYKDEKGQVTHLILQINGQEIQAKKVR